jgi:hypothetical protein
MELEFHDGPLEVKWSKLPQSAAGMTCIRFAGESETS